MTTGRPRTPARRTPRQARPAGPVDQASPGTIPAFRAKVVLMGAWLIVEVPRAVSVAVGVRGSVPVAGTVADGVPFRATLLPRGRGRHCLVLNAKVRAAAGIALGDRVAFDLHRDEEPRVGPTPDDLAEALDEQGVRETFDATGPGMRRQWLLFIDEAVQETTRAKRIAHVVEIMLRRREARIDREAARASRATQKTSAAHAAEAAPAPAKGDAKGRKRASANGRS